MSVMHQSLRKLIALWFLIFGLLSSLCIGCAANPKVQVDQGYDFSKKVTCAVLPFHYDNTGKKESAEMLRDVFTANLSEDDITLVKNAVVDTVLREKGMSGRKYTLEDLVKIGRWVGADIVVAGEMTKREKLYAVVHSNIRVAARIQVVDVRKGTVIFDIEKEEVRNAGLLRIPTGFVEAAASPIMGLDKYYEDKIVGELARDLVSPINIAFNPQKTRDARQPIIYDLSATVAPPDADGNRVLNVVLVGEERCSASFTIEGIAKDVPLSYIGNGNFTGSYVIPSGTTVALLKITGFLTSSEGEKSSCVIDITPELATTSDGASKEE